MQLDINNKVYSFKFGVGFIRELDSRYFLERDGMRFGMGLQAKVLPELQSFNVATLADVLKLANSTEKEKLSLKDIEEYIDNVEDIESLFDETLEALRSSNGGKLAIASFEKNLKIHKKA